MNFNNKVKRQVNQLENNYDMVQNRSRVLGTKRQSTAKVQQPSVISSSEAPNQPVYYQNASGILDRPRSRSRRDRELSKEKPKEKKTVTFHFAEEEMVAVR